MAHGKSQRAGPGALRGVDVAARRMPALAIDWRARAHRHGGGMFSAGVDLPRVVDGGASYVRVFLPAVNRMFQTLFAFSKPVVARGSTATRFAGRVRDGVRRRRRGLMARDARPHRHPRAAGRRFRFRWCRSRSCASPRPPRYIQSLAYRGLNLDGGRGAPSRASSRPSPIRIGLLDEAGHGRAVAGGPSGLGVSR